MKTLLIITLTVLFSACFSFYATAQEKLFTYQTKNNESFVVVDDVLNTATVHLRDGRKIKLIGLAPLDKPPRREPKRNEYNIIIEEDDPVVSLEETAFEFVVDLLKNKEVRIEFDNLYRDSEGYVLGYLFLKNGEFVNAEIIRQGFSNLHLTAQNKKYEDVLRDAYREASSEKRGLQGN